MPIFNLKGRGKEEEKIASRGREGGLFEEGH